MTTPRTVGLILAGGRSTRMHGRDKALLALAGEPLLAHVIARLAPQVDMLAINSNAPAGRFRAFGLPVIADCIGGFQGPLAGIHAGLATWPRDRLLAVAVDLPFLPHNLAAELRPALAHAPCAYAARGNRHALALLLAPGLAAVVADFLARGGRSLKEWLAAQARPVEFPATADADILFNINTPGDIAVAERRLHHGPY